MIVTRGWLCLHCCWWWCCIWWWGGLHLDLSQRRDSFGHLKLREQCWNCLLQLCWLHQSNMQLQSVTEWMTGNRWILLWPRYHCRFDLHRSVDREAWVTDWRSPNKIDTASERHDRDSQYWTWGTWSECCMGIVNLHRPEPLSSSTLTNSPEGLSINIKRQMKSYDRVWQYWNEESPLHGICRRINIA